MDIFYLSFYQKSTKQKYGKSSNLNSIKFDFVCFDLSSPETVLNGAFSESFNDKLFKLMFYATLN